MSVNRVSMGSDNGLSPIRRQAIIEVNAGLLWIGTLRTNFSDILIKIQNFSFTKMHLKISFAQWRSICSWGDELNETPAKGMSVRRAMKIGRTSQFQTDMQFFYWLYSAMYIIKPIFCACVMYRKWHINNEYALWSCADAYVTDKECKVYLISKPVLMLARLKINPN